MSKGQYDFYIDLITRNKDITQYSEQSLFIFISLIQFIKMDSLKGVNHNVCIAKLVIQYIQSLHETFNKSFNGKVLIDEVDAIFQRLERNDE